MNKAPVFQHRHYKAIAATLANAQNAVGQLHILAEIFANDFAKDNPRFDRARFLTAAKGEPSNGRDKVRS